MDYSDLSDIGPTSSPFGEGFDYSNFDSMPSGFGVDFEPASFTSVDRRLRSLLEKSFIRCGWAYNDHFDEGFPISCGFGCGDGRNDTVYTPRNTYDHQAGERTVESLGLADWEDYCGYLLGTGPCSTCIVRRLYGQKKFFRLVEGLPTFRTVFKQPKVDSFSTSGGLHQTGCGICGQIGFYNIDDNGARGLNDHQGRWVIALHQSVNLDGLTFSDRGLLYTLCVNTFNPVLDAFYLEPDSEDEVVG